MPLVGFFHASKAFILLHQLLMFVRADSLDSENWLGSELMDGYIAGVIHEINMPNT